MTARPIVYDVTYVAARLGAAAPTGIERVDAAYAARFAAAGDASPLDATAIHYGLLGPHRLRAATARRLLDEADRAWRAAPGLADDPVFRALASWLEAPTVVSAAARFARPPPPRRGLVQHRARTRWRLADDRAVVPHGALYLNVAQYAFEYPHFFRWLEGRPDIKPVFFIHDLLPLDCPEFFREGYGPLFERRVGTMARFARAAIVSNEVVGARVAQEMARRGRADLPILSAPLPPPTRSALVAEPSGDPIAGAAPYFVAVGTIEPRKNHLLLLNLWRDLALNAAAVPRLVLVGARGWDNEQVLDLLERSRLLGPHVAEVSGLSTPGLRRLIAGARALLMPSFAEGYGLPLAEALAEGTPVVASDIAVFREVSQGKALLLDPLDGAAWRRAVRDLQGPHAPLRDTLAALAAGYRSPTWAGHFDAVSRFLDGLSARPG